MKLSAILAIGLMFVGCGTIEDGAIDVGLGTEDDPASEKAGSGLGGKTVKTAESAGEFAGTFRLTEVTANDGFNVYYYSVSNGDCGFVTSHLDGMRYDMTEDNDCSLRDQYGDSFEFSDATKMIVTLDDFGSVIDVENMSSSNTGTGTGDEVISADVRITDDRAIIKVEKVVGGFDVLYTYKYSRN